MFITSSTSSFLFFHQKKKSSFLFKYHFLSQFLIDPGTIDLVFILFFRLESIIIYS